MSFRNDRSTVPTPGLLGNTIAKLQRDVRSLQAGQTARGVQVPLYQSDFNTFSVADGYFHGLLDGSVQGTGTLTITLATNGCIGCSLRLVVNGFAQDPVAVDGTSSTTLTFFLDPGLLSTISVEAVLTASTPLLYKISESRIA